MVSLVEALDTSCRIDELLRTREERIACRADFDMEVLGRGLGRDHIATGAMDFLESVLRMDILLHFFSSGLCIYRLLSQTGDIFITSASMVNSSSRGTPYYCLSSSSCQ